MIDLQAVRQTWEENEIDALEYVPDLVAEVEWLRDLLLKAEKASASKNLENGYCWCEVCFEGADTFEELIHDDRCIFRGLRNG